MRYAIIGTGAIGGYYGAKLANGGAEVHFLLHSDYEYVLKNGLLVNSCDGSFHIECPNAYRRTEDMPQCDVVIVALKTTNNHLLPSLLPPLLKPDTIVLLIQNGIGVEASVEMMFPNIQLAACLAFICSAKTEPGVVNHQCYGNINIGNYSCRDAARYTAMLDDMRNAGIGVANVEYRQARWKKAVWNMPFNGMTVALDTQTDRLLSNPATLNLIREQMMEVIGAANALGVEGLDESFADKMIRNTQVMVPYSPSMKLDHDFHRPMEIEFLYTRPIAEARAVGFAMPRLEMLEAILKFKNYI